MRQCVECESDVNDIGLNGETDDEERTERLELATVVRR